VPHASGELKIRTFLQTVGILTNSREWEFFVFKPKSAPPVSYMKLSTIMEDVEWTDVAALQQLFTPLLEQIGGILVKEIRTVTATAERAAKKRKNHPPEVPS
jgi:hypothetical protein